MWGQVRKKVVQALVSSLPRERSTHPSDPAGGPHEAVGPDAIMMSSTIDTPIDVTPVTDKGMQEYAKPVTQWRAAAGDDRGRVARDPGTGEEAMTAELGNVDGAVNTQVDVSGPDRAVHVAVTTTLRHDNGPGITPAKSVPTLTAATEGDFVRAVHLHIAA